MQTLAILSGDAEWSTDDVMHPYSDWLNHGFPRSLYKAVFCAASVAST